MKPITSKFTYEAYIKVINSMLVTASKYYGKLFGDYLYNVIIPSITNKVDIFQWNSVDIWFTSYKSLMGFLMDMDDYIECRNDHRSGVNIFAYSLIKYGEHVTDLNIYVTPQHPYIDNGLFSMDNLSLYMPSKNVGIMNFDNQSNIFSINNDLNDVKNKRAYVTYITEDYDRLLSYISSGWSVYIDNILIPEKIRDVVELKFYISKHKEQQISKHLFIGELMRLKPSIEHLISNLQSLVLLLDDNSV